MSYSNQSADQNDQLFRLPMVLQMIGKRRSTLLAEVKMGLFPAPYKIGKRAVAWKKSEVLAWMNALEKNNEDI